MNPITHILTGWCLAEAAPSLSRREKALITAAAVAPDVDGLGLVAEMATEKSARPLLWWSDYHHVLAHNLLLAVSIALLSLLIAWRGRSPVLTAAMAFVAVHIHIVTDLAGSRGPDGYQWPITYFYPFDRELQWTWSGQWALNAWPNIAATALLLALTMILAWRRGYSITSLVSARADRAFVGVLRKWFPAAGQTPN